jgi:hypothetical protein
MKALRLPSRVSAVAYLVRFRRPRFTPSVRVSPRGAPGRSEVSPRPGLLVSRRPTSPAPRYVDTVGISQVSRRSIPCLCCVPGPRSNRRVLVKAATSMLPPLSGPRGLRHWLISRLTPAASAPALLRFALPLLSRARLASGWLTGLCQEGVVPSGSRWKVSARIHDHPPSLYS